MPFGAGHWPYLIILLVIVLIIWGPGKLPDLGSALGKGIREFRKASNEVKDQIVSTTATEQPAPPAPAVQPAPVPPEQAAQPVVQAAPPAAPAAGPVQPVGGGQPTEHPSA
ncbi:MAG TPA: twin-arginine translocase TatA/TatE family subunit [Candidatus Angelobacter sp.]|jgi:sec-independent protein translocase protein TatA|nr:twin-arginine translocase TatA/TatE family subunit [Candidatus Angelobacter sp.]